MPVRRIPSFPSADSGVPRHWKERKASADGIAFFFSYGIVRGKDTEGCADMDYQDINARTIDLWVENGWEWGTPISHDVYEKAKNGEWEVLLTPVRPVPHAWIGTLEGKSVLGLACGGGQQIPIFSALGAECTVLDYSQRQLDAERMVAEREGYRINIVHADMTKPLPFESDSFDLIFHPVANCYVENVRPIWQECFRVLKKGGCLLAGMDNGINFIFDDSETTVKHVLPFNPLVCEEHRKSLGEEGGIQFSHTIEDLIGGQLAAGFRLMDVYEDTNGRGNLHEHHIPTFWATRAVKE